MQAQEPRRTAGSKHEVARHWWARRRRVSSGEPKGFRERVFGTLSVGLLARMGRLFPAAGGEFLPSEGDALRSRQV